MNRFLKLVAGLILFSAMVSGCAPQSPKPIEILVAPSGKILVDGKHEFQPEEDASYFQLVELLKTREKEISKTYENFGEFPEPFSLVREFSGDQIIIRFQVCN